MGRQKGKVEMDPSTVWLRLELWLNEIKSSISGVQQYQKAVMLRGLSGFQEPHYLDIQERVRIRWSWCWWWKAQDSFPEELGLVTS